MIDLFLIYIITHIKNNLYRHIHSKKNTVYSKTNSLKICLRNKIRWQILYDSV